MGEPGADAGQELVGIDGLGQIVDGAAAHRLHDAARLDVGGDDDAGHGGPRGAQLPEQRDAVAVAEHEIHDGEGRLLGLGEPPRLDGAARGEDHVAGGLERLDEDAPHHRVVVDDEDREALSVAAHA